MLIISYSIYTDSGMIRTRSREKRFSVWLAFLPQTEETVTGTKNTGLVENSIIEALVILHGTLSEFRLFITMDRIIMQHVNNL